MKCPQKTVETCFSPALYKYQNIEDCIVVVVDILRASSSVCTAIDFGISEIIPVGSLEEAKEFKNKGFIVAAERDGKILDFADIGNSPNDFLKDELKGKTIAYSTTNGTQTMLMGKDNYMVIIGSFLNLTAVSELLIKSEKNVLILCSGWKNRFSLEDALFAGALAEKLLKSDIFCTICDSVFASVDIWNLAKHDIDTYIEKCAHKHRLQKLGLADVIPYCFEIDKLNSIPLYKDGKITRYAQP
jgi:2-phosphosulfolactate phosphatase